VAYLYETHLHTSEVSKCAGSGGADYIAVYKDMGYTGIIITDHFYNGNCALSRKLPWEEWVTRFYRGYEKAKEEGERHGVDVFFGWEETFDNCDDYLVYGLDKEWLLQHSEVRWWSRGEQYHAVRAAGGCVVQAHPFRQRFYINRIILSPYCVDAVEVANGGHEDVSIDALACRYAKYIGKPMVAGTDGHDTESVYYNDHFGIYSEKKFESINDYVKLILENKILGIKIDEGRLDFHGNESVRLPVEIRDHNDKITGRHWKEMIFDEK